MKIQFGRQREATIGGVLAQKDSRRPKSWPTPAKPRLRYKRETSIPGLLGLLFASPDTEEKEMNFDISGEDGADEHRLSLSSMGMG